MFLEDMCRKSHVRGLTGLTFHLDHVKSTTNKNMRTSPLWCLKAPGPATKKWIFEFFTKFGFRNHLQTFWPRRLKVSYLLD